MSRLVIYPEQQPDQVQIETALALEISELLADYGIVFKQRAWQGDVDALLMDKEAQSNIKRDIVPLDRQHQFPFQSLIVIDQNYPNYDSLRLKYLSEFSVNKDEILYLLEGRLLLSFHSGGQVIQLLCQAGDLLITPAGINHWLDIGEASERLSMMFCKQQEQESILNYSGSNIADLFERLA